MESDLVNEQRRTGCKLALEVLTGQAVLVRCSDVVKNMDLVFRREVEAGNNALRNY